MNKKSLFYLLIPIALGIYLYRKLRDVSNPELPPLRGKKLGKDLMKYEGIYDVLNGREFTGQRVVVKCNRCRNEYFLSFFCESAGLYFVIQGSEFYRKQSFIGYWRDLVSFHMGIIRLQILPEGDDIIFAGSYSNKNDKNQQELYFLKTDDLPENKDFEIIGHRGGGRNLDFLPVSENSAEMLRMSTLLGCTGVEIDIRLTKDKVPVLFHDSFLSLHTMKKSLYSGLLHNYTWEELKTKKLRKEGGILSLEEALEIMYKETELRTIWLDMKFEEDFSLVQKLQEKYEEKAKKEGRDLKIYMGLADDRKLKLFEELPHYKKLTSLVETEPKDLERTGSQVWAPQYTQGFNKEEADAVHKKGKKVFVWSLDHPKMVKTYLEEGEFDGMVTNSAPTVAFHIYTALVKEKEMS